MLSLTPYDAWKLNYPAAWDDEATDERTFDEMVQDGCFEEVPPVPSELFLAGFIEQDELAASTGMSAIEIGDLIFGPATA